MLSLEAMLTVPLSLVIFVQSLLYLSPLMVRNEKQATDIAQNRISVEKNQKLYEVRSGQGLAQLEVNPQKVQEAVALARDLKQVLMEADRGS